jgi:hypothetical protein
VAHGTNVAPSSASASASEGPADPGNRIHSEFSGHMRDALHFIARGAEMDGQGVTRDAELLEAAMAGMGTKDERL